MLPAHLCHRAACDGCDVRGDLLIPFMLQLKPNCFAAIHAVGEMGVSDNLDSEVNHEAQKSCPGDSEGRRVGGSQEP